MTETQDDSSSSKPPESCERRLQAGGDITEFLHRLPASENSKHLIIPSTMGTRQSFFQEKRQFLREKSKTSHLLII